MDNQHREIKGYRELDAEEIALMNEIKELGPRMTELEQKLKLNAADGRWIAIGTTHIQQGLMAWTRSIAKPTFF